MLSKQVQYRFVVNFGTLSTHIKSFYTPLFFYQIFMLYSLRWNFFRSLSSTLEFSAFLNGARIYSKNASFYQQCSSWFSSVNPLGYGRFSNPYFKVLWEGGRTKFLVFFFFYRGISNKKACKVKNFQVWEPKDNFELNLKRKGGRGVRGPHGLRG